MPSNPARRKPGQRFPPQKSKTKSPRLYFPHWRLTLASVACPKSPLPRPVYSR